MPEFTPDDINISPDEFVNSCNKSEISELIDELVTHGFLDQSAISSEQNNETINHKDCEFVDALNHLRNKRHLLTTVEENLIIQLAERFKHL